ncbi:MAG TPA: methyltransferase domain-containing protein [Gemmatimonadales bacterium]
MRASIPPDWAAPPGTELLDDRRADPDAVRAELADIARLNRLFGGTRAVLEALEPLLTAPSEPRATLKDSLTVARNAQRRLTLLDIGTGAGDIPQAVVATAERHGVSVLPIGLDVIPAAARLARRNGVRSVVGDGNAPPFAPKSVDLVVASQVLHHLPPAVAVTWLREFDRLARRAVVVADLYRSRLAMAGVWLAAGPLGMSGASRRDAVVSLRRGFTVPELESLLDAAGVRARVFRRPWARIVAVWEPRQ